MSIIFLLFALISFLFVFGVGALIGFFVYRDATKKEMSNPILWALLAVFAPSFIGLIIYFIVRSSYPKNNSTPNSNYYNATSNNSNPSTTTRKTTCSFCGCTIQGNYVKCPHCGVSLQPESPENHNANTDSGTMF